jgi:RHS repeat-associated protein
MNAAVVFYKFPGKERDTGTGLDYFGARFYGSNMGRFMTPDPLMLSGKHLAMPQRWNAYAYVRNTPLVLIDPNGLDDYTYDQSGNVIKDKTVKRSWLHNLFVGDSHTLQAKDGSTYKLSEALKPLKNGQEYQIIGASQTSQLMRSFLSSQGPSALGQSLGLKETANRAADPKQWNWKIEQFGPHSLFVLGDTAQRSDYLGNVAFGYLMNAWNVRIPGYNSTESAIVGGAVFNMYDSFRSGANAFKGSAFSLYDDPRDIEAIQVGGKMYKDEHPED